MQDNHIYTIGSEDGQTYSVRLWQASIISLASLWDRYSEYRVLFSDITLDNFEVFASMVLSPHTVVLNIFHEDTEVGVVYLTEMRPLSSALFHYVIWDRKFPGRQRLALTIMRKLMEEFNFHRLNMTVPIYAYSALHHAHKLGLRIEGLRKEGIAYYGKRYDQVQFGILLSELTDETLEACRIVHDKNDPQHNWYGLLKRKDRLLQRIMKHGTGPEDQGDRSTSRVSETSSRYAGSGSISEPVPA